MLQAQPDDLPRFCDRAAAKRDDQIRPCGAGELRRFEHGRTRREGRHTIVCPGVSIAERDPHLLDLVGRAIHRAAHDKEHPVRSNAFDFGSERRRGRFAVHHSLQRGELEDTLVHANLPLGNEPFCITLPA
jgi:hypothetical protein